MRQIILLTIVILMVMAAGCQKKGKVGEGAVEQTNDMITELIKEDILSNSSNKNLAMNTNNNLTEPIANGQAQASDMKKEDQHKNLMIEPQLDKPIVKKDTTTKKTADMKDKQIKDNAIAVDEPETKAVVTKATGSFMKIGNDTAGQSVSPRKTIKITVAAFTKSAKYVDFNIYALPKGSSENTDGDYLIARVRNIDVIQGQAQLTKYWNGKNVSGDFLDPGRYTIYLVYTLKDGEKNTIKKESRFWGGSNKITIKLY